GFIPFAVTEPHLLSTQLRTSVEAAAGNDRHADVLHQIPREFQIILKPDICYVCHNVIRAVGLETSETGLFQYAQQVIPPPLIVALKLLVIAKRQAQSVDSGFLQRGRRADGEKVMNLTDAVDQIGGGDRVTHTPARD